MHKFQVALHGGEIIVVEVEADNVKMLLQWQKMVLVNALPLTV
jgi:hypothetical protein